MMYPICLVAVLSYLLGSIPFGYLLVRTFRGQDIRQTGSGNIGATNVSRTSPLLGVCTLVLDAIKGFVAVVLAGRLFPGQTALLGWAAVMAIAGHMFPVWLKFRGGKGVATGLGSFVAVVPKTVLLMVGVFVVLLLAFRYVSLASILTVALFPLQVWASHPYPDVPWLLACVAVSSLLIVAKHHQNIRRLLTHTEPRFQWRRG